MRKSLLAILLCGWSVFALAQSPSKHTFSVNANAVLGQAIDEDYGADFVTANVAYTYKILPKLQLGGGIGIGTGNIMRTYSPSIVDEDVKTGNSMVVPIFARVKYNFSTKPTSLFVQLDGGYSNATLEDWSGENYNPLGGYFTPSVGCDIAAGNGKISLQAGIQVQYIQYNDVKYKYSSVLKDLIYDSFVLSKTNFTGLFFSVGYSF